MTTSIANNSLDFSFAFNSSAIEETSMTIVPATLYSNSSQFVAEPPLDFLIDNSYDFQISKKRSWSQSQQDDGDVDDENETTELSQETYLRFNRISDKKQRRKEHLPVKQQSKKHKTKKSEKKHKSPAQTNSSISDKLPQLSDIKIPENVLYDEIVLYSESYNSKHTEPSYLPSPSPSPPLSSQASPLDNSKIDIPPTATTINTSLQEYYQSLSEVELLFPLEDVEELTNHDPLFSDESLSASDSAAKKPLENTDALLFSLFC